MSGDMDAKGNVPLAPRAVVLFSGGLDSTLSLHWGIMRYRDLFAVSFDYGQPHRDAELCAAAAIAARRGIDHCVDRIMMPVGGFLSGVRDHHPAGGRNPAFVPGRNLVFLSMALAHGMRRWGGESFDIVIGACAEDADGYDDCRLEFFRAAEGALSKAVGVQIEVAAPFVKMTKAEALHTARLRFPAALEDVAGSWSCYRGQGPCGACTACVLRAQAFLAMGIEDRCAAPRVFGGDVHRDMGLR